MRDRAGERETMSMASAISAASLIADPATGSADAM